VYALTTLSAGDLVAGGYFTTAGGAVAPSIARWNGSAWSRLASGLNLPVHALTVLPNGDLVAGGEFTFAGSVTARRIARWNGAAWSPMASGMTDGFAPIVYDLASLPNGDVIAGGRFTSAGGVPANNIARWNGSSWSPLGAGIGGFPSIVFALAAMPNGELAAGGFFDLAGDLASPYFARYSFTGAPTVSLSPSPRTIAPGQMLTLTATPANGYANVSVQWQRDGVNITDGPAGASAALTSPTSASTATLTITNAAATDSGEYTAVFTNTCGSLTTLPATVTVHCPADVNADGLVDGDDVILFFRDWDATSPDADYNADARVDILDVIAFFADWDEGC
jgi:hypothetical protein